VYRLDVIDKPMKRLRKLTGENSMRIKSILILVASAFLLFGCGDGSAISPPPAPEPTNAGGIWEGTATTSGATLEFGGVISEEGEGRFFDDDGTQYIVSNLSGNDGSITLEFTAVAQSGFTFLDGSTVTTGNLSGTVVERTSFSGDYTMATGEAGTLSLTYNEIYERDSSHDKLTGMWEGGFGVATFDPDGSFFEQDEFGCVLDGQASIIDPQYNAYELSMTVSNCGPSDGQYAGLGMLLDFDTTEDLLIFQMNSDDLIFTTTLLRL
jgi:hypothetical protein